MLTLAVVPVSPLATSAFAKAPFRRTVNGALCELGVITPFLLLGVILKELLPEVPTPLLLTESVCCTAPTLIIAEPAIVKVLSIGSVPEKMIESLPVVVRLVVMVKVLIVAVAVAGGVVLPPDDE